MLGSFSGLVRTPQRSAESHNGQGKQACALDQISWRHVPGQCIEDASRQTKRNGREVAETPVEGFEPQ